MGRLDASRPHVERRKIKLINLQHFKPDGCAHNIHNRIHRSHFVKMDALDAHTVNFRFRFP